MAAPVTGTFTATGQSATFQPIIRERSWGQMNVSASGTFVATVQLERSFDSGSTWFVCSADGYGTAAAYTAPFSVVAEENVNGTIYRLNCTAYTSGTVAYRISQ